MSYFIALSQHVPLLDPTAYPNPIGAARAVTVNVWYSGVLRLLQLDSVNIFLSNEQEPTAPCIRIQHLVNSASR